MDQHSAETDPCASWPSVSTLCSLPFVSRRPSVYHHLREPNVCCACRGAEGTIIEEVEDLPQIIWGLENDTHQNVRPSHQHQSYQHQSHQHQSHQHQLPPHQKPNHHVRRTTGESPRSARPAGAAANRDVYARTSPSVSLTSPSTLTPRYIRTVDPSLPMRRSSVGPRPNMAHLSATSAGSPSAFELAQEYRNQQFAQATQISPPSSSSTQWTPVFSAYGDFLDTPELQEHDAAAVHVAENDFYDMHDMSNYAYEPTYGAGLNVRNVDMPADYADRTTIKSTVNQHQDAPVSSFVPPVQPSHDQPTSSPGGNHPKSAALTAQHPARSSVSEQGPRSVPLARLIQRQLATVPEEVGSTPFGRRRLSTSTGLTPRSLNAPYFQNQAKITTPADGRAAEQMAPISAAPVPNPTEAAVRAVREGMERSVGIPSNKMQSRRLSVTDESSYSDAAKSHSRVSSSQTQGRQEKDNRSEQTNEHPTKANAKTVPRSAHPKKSRKAKKQTT